jgi:hypothetical protein
MHELLLQLLWLAIEIFCSGGVDLSVGRQREAADEPWGRGFQLTLAGLLTLLLGLLSSLAVRHRVLPNPSRSGLSMILVPLVLACVMHVWGRVTGATTRPKRSYLATWYGGALMGAGLAAGRLFGLTYF